jgi:DNA-binding GntR family transcriptional regulator
MDRLAEELGISRTPVRDALRRLERERVIRSTGGKGYEVRPIDDEELDHMYKAREAVEGYAAEAVAAAPEAVRTALAAEFAAAARLPMTTPREVYVANRAIHRAVLEATGNRHLTEMFDMVWSRGLASQVWADLIRNGMAGSEDFATAHADLLKAIVSGDPGEARKAAMAHVREGRHLH